MTEEELNALIGGMDQKTPKAIDPPAEERRAPASDRTPSMLVRQTLRGEDLPDENAGAAHDVPDASSDETDDPHGEDLRQVDPALEPDPVIEAVEDHEDHAVEDPKDWDAGPVAEEPSIEVSDGKSEAEHDDFGDRASSEAPENTRPEPAHGAPDVEEPEFAETEDSVEDASEPLTLVEPVDKSSEIAAGADTEAAEEDLPLRKTPRGVSLRRSEVAPDAVPKTSAEDDRRKPRIILMGEFSAGKSTLMNLLLGEPALPVNTTATQLPPVWITKGSGDAAMRVDLEGFEEPVDLTATDIPLADTHYIRLQKNADLLDLCDLIDTPGISDPNMPAEIWQRMIQHADVVIWCTHATQAWRQSEAAAWSMMPQKLQKRSLLLLTRFDKVASDRDRLRVLKRVRSETEGLFRDIFPISLTDAIEAGDDKDAFAASGGESFADALFEVIGLIQRRDASVQTRPRSQLAPFKLEPEAEPVRVVTPRRVRPRPLAARPLGTRGGALREGG